MLAHHYRAFGLQIASQIALRGPVACEAAGGEDCEILLGDACDAVAENRWQTDPDRCEIDIKNVARFQVENGRLIRVQPCHGTKAADWELFLLGSCMGAVLFQRRVLPLHGSCVMDAGRGLLVTGASGAGKSTVAAALLARGARLITDDVAAVRLSPDGVPTVSPSYPSQKLWEDAIRRMQGITKNHTLNRVMNDYDKFAVERRASFYDEPAPLRAVFTLEAGETDCVSMTEITGVQKVAALIRNTYRGFLPAQMGIAGWHLTQVAAVAERVKVFRIVRPAGEHAEARIAESILTSGEVRIP